MNQTIQYFSGSLSVNYATTMERQVLAVVAPNDYYSKNSSVLFIIADDSERRQFRESLRR